MSFHAFIQRVFFNTYVDWHMKNPSFDRDGFHIVGIDNSVKAMRDGYFTYTQIRPPRPIHGCTSITARVADAEGVTNLHLRIADTTYRIANVSYEETTRLLRAFVTKSVLPDRSRWVEVPSGEEERTAQRFAELVDLLLGDPRSGQRFLSTALPKNSGDFEEAWLELSEELIGCGKAVELGLRTERDDFLVSVKGLLPDSLPRIDESALSEDACIMQWCAAINSSWSEHVLAAMDIGSDTYVMLVLDAEEFARARRLARSVLLRIAPAEQM